MHHRRAAGEAKSLRSLETREVKEDSRPVQWTRKTVKKATMEDGERSEEERSAKFEEEKERGGIEG